MISFLNLYYCSNFFCTWQTDRMKLLLLWLFACCHVLCSSSSCVMSHGKTQVLKKWSLQFEEGWGLSEASGKYDMHMSKGLNVRVSSRQRIAPSLTHAHTHGFVINQLMGSQIQPRHHRPHTLTLYTL